MNRLRLLSACLVVTILAASCASGRPSEKAAPTTTKAAVPVTLPSAFTGSIADFYAAPSPLPAGKPGQLIRIQSVSRSAEAVTVRVMYHSIDADHRDQPVTGIVSYPTAPAPAGGWPVTSTAPGTVGLHTTCALSRLDNSPPDYGISGVHVQTDYIGMVDGQRQRYLSGTSEAHSVIDAVRAARNIPAAHTGSRWVAVGQSQGGHSALFTNQLAAAYAPELHLLGTISVAPAAMLTKTYGPQDQVIPRMVGIMALFGIAADHPTLDPNDYVGDQVKAAEGVIDTGCTNEIINAFVGIAPDVFYAHDPLTTEPAAAIVAQNDPGKVKAVSPLLLGYGTNDIYVVPERALALYGRLCRVGQVTQLWKLDGADHGNEMSRGATQIHDWIAARFAGVPPVNSCAK